MSNRIAVLGGGVRGLSLALAYRELGADVALVEPRGTLGNEFTVTGHSWIRNGSTQQPLYVPQGEAKKLAMAQALDAGVQPLLMSYAAGAFVRGGKASGVLLAGKYGLARLAADLVVDATGGEALAPAFQTGFQDARQAVVSYVFEAGNVKPFVEERVPVPAQLELEDGAVRVFMSLLPNVAMVELQCRIKISCMPGGIAQANRTMREKAVQVFSYLRENWDRFSGAKLNQMADEARIVWQDAPVYDLPEGFVRFHEALPLEINTRDIRTIRQHAQEFASAHPVRENVCEGEDVLFVYGQETPFAPQPGYGLPQGMCSGKAWPRNLTEYRVQTLIAGAGTAGCMAGEALCEGGKDFALIEPFYALGGTRTVGRVVGNYFGNFHGAAKRMADRVAQLDAELGGDGNFANGTCRALLYQRDFDRAGAQVFAGAMACGAEVKAGKISRVLAVSEEGLFCVSAEVVIDATSDADVAAFAGVPYQIGSPRDGATMTNSQWGDTSWRTGAFYEAAYHGDYDMVAGDRYDDMLRAIYVAHGFNSDLSFTNFNTLRESRRIQGRYTLTLTDALLHRDFPDAIATGYTPYDTHGRASSVLVNMGLLRYDVNPIAARVPYRCFLPADISNMLVCGKAVSATRDANSLVRMNADIENAGWAMGLVSSKAVEESCADLAELDVRAIREALLADGSMSEPLAPIMAEDAIREMAERPSLEALLHCVLQEKHAVVPRLQALAQSPERDMALAFFGDESGVRAVAKMLDHAEDISDYDMLRASRGYGLARTRFEGELAPYFKINCMISILGVSANPAGLDAVLRFAEKATSGGPMVEGEGPYHKRRVDSRVVPCFDRLAALAFALERFGSPKAIPALKRILNDPYISGYDQTNARETINYPCGAWLELALARALARSGGIAGYRRLAKYADDPRAVMRMHANRELAELTGRPGEALRKAEWDACIDSMDAFVAQPCKMAVTID